MQLRALAADWAGGIEPNDPALLGQKASKDEKAPPLASRPVAPSATQLELIRSMVYSFFAWKSLGKKGAYSDKDFDDDDIKVLKDFYNRSFFYRYNSSYSTHCTRRPYCIGCMHSFPTYPLLTPPLSAISSTSRAPSLRPPIWPTCGIVSSTSSSASACSSPSTCRCPGCSPTTSSRRSTPQ